MKTKSTFLFIVALLQLFSLSAQISEIEQIFCQYSEEYVPYTSIVRNYDDKHNVLMMYGHYSNVVYTDSITGRSSFVIQNTATGALEHLFDLPLGYQVNDIKFVTLRKMDGVSTVDYCCFCGTRTQFEGIVYPFTPEGETPYYIYTYSTHGFAGFFSMEEALNPSSSFTAKVRDIEKTKELYKMECYPEQYGKYYQYQNTFIDNAVLDIIGVDDTVNKPSCYCRAKFYPVYTGGGIRWDNNIRYNNYDVLTDITKTDDYVVATSNNVAGDSLWIRYSDQEDHHCPGGLELNDYVNAIDFSLMTMQINCYNSIGIADFSRESPARICHTTDNGTELCFLMDGQGFGGLLNCQYTYSNGALSFHRGAYLKGSQLAKDLIYMPLNDATAVLFNDNTDYVSVLTWTKNTYCNFPVVQFYNEDFGLHSITLQKRNGYEHLFWTGDELNNLHSPVYLMSQRGEQGGGYEQTCHSRNYDEAQPVTIKHAVENKRLRIGLRFAYDDVTYPVTYINFYPYELEKEFQCVMEQ